MQDLKPQGDAVFALDIGTRTVVGIVGVPDDDGNFHMKEYVVVPHTKRAMIDGQIEDIKQVAKIVGQVKDKLQEKSGIKLEHVSIAAAGRALKTKHVSMEFDISETEVITFDTVKSMELETIQKASVELQSEQSVLNPYYCVGHSIVSYLLDDYKMLSLEGHKGQKVSIELIATFLPNIVVEGLYAVTDTGGLRVSSMTLEPIAAMNAIIPQEIRLINIALVDIGAGTSDIAISRDGSIIAYAMATTAGDEITEEIIKTYFVDFNTAETIKQKCCGGDDCTYRDIFGLEHVITPEEFAEKIEPSVDVLAETICSHIIEANGGAPSAVFLIGGGSLVKGLPEAVCEKLSLPAARVALGNHEKLKNIDTGGVAMGAEFVTPLGIAVTGIINKGYDFSVISLNGKDVRVFDTNKITVFELLTMAGYKSADILGRSGHNLTFTINGERRIIRGGGFEPAVVTLGGKPVSLNAHVTGGDKVEFTPAICGENASLLLKDALDPDGSPFPPELVVKVNGVSQSPDYSIKNFDDIVTSIAEDELPVLPEEPEKATSGESVFTGESTYEEESWGEITVMLNEKRLTLPPHPQKTPHTFLELLNHSDMDFDNPKGAYIMTINGEKANFNDEIKHGDKAVLRWE